MSAEITGLDELRNKILEDARREADKIIEEARRKAEEIIEEARRKYEEKVRKEREKIIENAKIQAQIIRSDAKRQARIILSKAKYELIEEVFNKSKEVIAERKGFDIYKSIENLLREAFEYIEPHDIAKIIVHEKDLDIANKVARSLGLKADILINKEILGGVIAESKDGKTVNNTYDVRLERAKTTLVPIIAKILWG